MEIGQGAKVPSQAPSIIQKNELKYECQSELYGVVGRI